MTFIITMTLIVTIITMTIITITLIIPHLAEPLGRVQSLWVSDNVLLVLVLVWVRGPLAAARGQEVDGGGGRASDRLMDI